MLVEERSASPAATPLQPQSTPPSASAAPLQYVLWAVIAAAFTCFVLQYSLRHDRLAQLPSQDDITYISDGLDRLTVFYNQGFAGSFHYYRISPPRSPVGSCLAALGFALFGFKDWAPYATNGIFVFVLLWMIWILMRGARLWAHIAATVSVLCVPVSLLLVNEFRTDLACGLVTAFAIVTVLRKPFVSSPLGHKLAVGALFGGALVMKPTILLGTLVFAVAGISLAALRDIALAGNPWEWRGALYSVLLAAATMLAVSLIYFWFGWRTVWDILVLNLFNSDNRKIWSIPGDLSVQLRYYLDGPGGQFLLRGYVYLLLAVLICGAAAMVAVRRRWAMYTALCMGLMVGLTYFTVSLSPGKNPFGGATFTWLLIFLSLLVCRAAIDRNRVWLPRLPWAGGLLAFVCLISLYILRMPQRDRFVGLGYVKSAPDEAAFQASNQFVWNVFSTVMDKLDEAPLGRRRLFITTYGWINYPLLKYLAEREDRSPREVPLLLPPDRADLNLFERQIDKAELILASESGNNAIDEIMPSASMQDRSLALAESHSDLLEIRRFSTPNGKQFHLFEKAGDFAGWYRCEGFSRLLDADRDHNLPESRVGYGPSSKIFFTRFEDGISMLHLRGKSLEPEERIVLNIDGRRAAGFDLHASGGLEDFSYEMNLARGDHIVELSYSSWQNSADARAVRFTNIQLTPRK